MAEQRYRVVERLEAGGMAEVFLGEAASVQGFKKRVAIKRVLPHLAQNKNFMGMFLDEARLGARLNHANIVTVFDIGAADNTYFIVMEYVDGVNLKGIMEGVRKRGRHFPLKEAIYLCMEACRGLSYAHELTDEAGEPLHIVHRDISPPNILVSKRGEVKVTDFGLAKATNQLEKTDPGVVKGKFSYLSPEAAQGQPVDARTDLYALGIVLWEMLAGRRLFLGETDYQTVKLVQAGEIPSLQKLNPEVDAEFEKLLLQILARDPNDRFQSAREMGDALAGYLFSHKLKVTSYDIANLVKQTLAETPKAKAEHQSIIDKLIQEELVRFTSIDDMSNPLQPGAKPLSPDDVSGALPLEAGLFENPADWFREDPEVAAAIEQHAPTDEDDKRWHESGLERLETEGDLATLLESDAPVPAKPSRNSLPTVDAPAGSLAVAAASLPPESAKSGGGAWVFILIALLLAGAGAAAWFGGII